jgi:hypothetical protein
MREQAEGVLAARRSAHPAPGGFVPERTLARRPGQAHTKCSQSPMPNPEYEIRARVPGKIPLRDLSRCIKIVQRGDAVDPDSVSVELTRSHILAFALAGGHIVGVGAIKRRRPAYARQIAERSGISFDPNASELGYVAIEPNHRGRGLSELIVQELLVHHPHPLFATTSSKRMKKTLARVGFAERGGTWPGRNGYQLSLWFKEAPDGASACEE